MTADTPASSPVRVPGQTHGPGTGELPRAIEVDICDPHHHLHDVANGSGGYTVDDFRSDAAGLPVVKTVYIECSEKYRRDGPEHLRPVGETEWVAGQTDGQIATGIVGYADLMSPLVGETIAAHIDAGRGRFRGVRRRTGWDPDPAIGTTRVKCWEGMLLTPSFQAGVRTVGDHGLTFDAFIYFHQLAEVVELARRAPETVIIVDHLGGLLGVGRYAHEKDEVAAVWRAGIKAAAATPNIMLKIGGLGRPLAGTGWDKAQVKPSSWDIAEAYADDLRWTLDQFGTQRCMFESNFPLDRPSFSYAACWNAFDLITADFSSADRRNLFHDTAARIYHLDS